MRIAATHGSKIFKVTVISTAALAVSVMFTAAILMVLDGSITVKPLLIACVCSIAAAAPISSIVLTQSERLAHAHTELIAAHRELAEINAQLGTAHRELALKASHDEMTGLLNRAAFLERLENLRRCSDMGYLLMIDADRFKDINDTYGHLAGDRALVAIATALKSGVREADICGRIGGEEFTVYLPGADHENALDCAERLREAVASMRVDTGAGSMVELSVSIGAAPFKNGQGIDDVMREADRLLYQAKSTGRNRVCIAKPVLKAA